MSNLSLLITQFFKNHPQFPFTNWFKNYDDYCATNLLLLNIVKSKISSLDLKNWSNKNNYTNYRVSDSEGIYYPFSCINHKKQMVLSIGIAKSNDKDLASMSISLDKEKFYWEAYKYEDVDSDMKFYYALNIYYDPIYDDATIKLDEILKLFFASDFTSLEAKCGYYLDDNFSELLKDF